MNHVFNYAQSVSNQLNWNSVKNFFSQLTPLQKKVAVLSVAIFGIYMANKLFNFFPKKKRISSFHSSNSFSNLSISKRLPIHREDRFVDNSQKKFIVSETSFEANQNLTKAYKDITDLENELEEEHEKLSKPKVNEEDDVTRIADISSSIEGHLTHYPHLFRTFLESNTHDQLSDKGNVVEQIAIISALLDRYPYQEFFIQETLRHIYEFLDSNWSNTFSEHSKKDLIIYHEFFSIANKHLNTIGASHPELAVNLKIKLANLPLLDDDRHLKFPNIYLTEKEQGSILFNHFQENENKMIDAVIAKLDTIINSRLDEEDLHQIAKCVSEDKSNLSDTNRTKLESRLKDLLGDALPSSWDYENVVQFLKNYQKTMSTNQDIGYELDSLYAAAKAKYFFERQLNNDESAICIPRWYHTTQLASLDPIINSGIIKVLHQQAFKGAWVSTQREDSMGNGESTLVFTHHISKLDPNVFIGFENGEIRWRGLQTPITLKDPKGQLPFLTIISLFQSDRNLFKNDKQIVSQTLASKHISNIKFMTNRHLEYLQKEVERVIGSPNLTEKWWGKADVNELESRRDQFMNV